MNRYTFNAAKPQRPPMPKYYPGLKLKHKPSGVIVQLDHIYFAGPYAGSWRCPIIPETAQRQAHIVTDAQLDEWYE